MSIYKKHPYNKTAKTTTGTTDTSGKKKALSRRARLVKEANQLGIEVNWTWSDSELIEAIEEKRGIIQYGS